VGSKLGKTCLLIPDNYAVNSSKVKHF